MPPVAAQNPSPVEHLGKSRLLVSITALVAVACVLAAVFIYLQSGQNIQKAPIQPAVSQKTMEIDQALSQLKGAVPATQAEIQSALKQLSGAKPATQSQIDQTLSQLKAQ